ncbi:sensor histidine kinase [Nonomuraea sp. NPDC050394]|uniref:sensor histidine kinase n=1 Tax=Nonomuraea sp. NPDC050394 TaxID=3364363 RepID=UPI0037B53DDE
MGTTWIALGSAGERWLPRSPVAITRAVVAGFALDMLINVVWSHTRDGLAGFAACFAVVVALQLAHSTREPRTWPWWSRTLTLGAQALATYLPLLWMGPWGGMAGFLAGSVLLMVPGPWRWALYLAVGASIPPLALAHGVSAVTAFWLAESTLLSGLIVYGVSSLAAMVAEAHAARGELARMAVVREQLRVARNLRGLLDANLSAITRTIGRVSRLLPRHPDRAREEVGEALQTARQALADVRAAAWGYRRMSLAAEAETALSTLVSAGIDTRAVIPDGPLPGEADTVLAIVLREAATNVLRHSDARSCRIEARAAAGSVLLSVVNDGAGGAAAGSGTALESLRLRVEAVGGTLSAVHEADGRFLLTARVPLAAADAAPPSGQTSVEISGTAPPRRPAAPPTPWAPRTAVVMTVVVLTAYAGVTMVFSVSEGLGGAGLAAAAVCFALISALQLAHSSDLARRWPPRVRALTLSVQAAATYLPLLWAGQRWGAMAGFLAGSILLWVPGPLRWALYTAVAASIAAATAAAGLAPISIVYAAVFTLLTGLIVYGITSLQALVFEIHAARGSLARMAVVRERLRVARDLHDLLGYNLSAITLKTELTYRLLPGSPERARAEAEESLDIARQALVDVGGAASGSHAMSLAAEGDSSMSTLTSADIEATLDLACGPLPPYVETVLGIVLREATTNVLRHSKATRCVIEAEESGGAVRLRVANDGVEPGTLPRPGGTGLPNLRTRVEALGGSLTAGPGAEGWFVVVAEVPGGA